MVDTNKKLVSNYDTLIAKYTHIRAAVYKPEPAFWCRKYIGVANCAV